AAPLAMIVLLASAPSVVAEAGRAPSAESSAEAAEVAAGDPAIKTDASSYVPPASGGIGIFVLPPANVGGSSSFPCAVDMFAGAGGETFSISRPLSPPFRATNFRVVTPPDNCGGTAVTLPVHVNQGQALTFDLVFTPTEPLTFQDALVISSNSTFYLYGT